MEAYVVAGFLARLDGNNLTIIPSKDNPYDPEPEPVILPLTLKDSDGDEIPIDEKWAIRYVGEHVRCTVIDGVIRSVET